MEPETVSEVTAQHSKLAMISRVTDRLVRTLNFDEGLKNLIEGASELLEVERASIMIFDPGHKTLSIRVAIGVDQEVIESTRVRIGDGIAGKVAETGKPLIMWDVRQLAERDEERDFGRYRSGSALCVPLAIHGKVQGVMNFTHKTNGVPFQKDDLEFALLIANQAAIVIYSSLLHAEFLEKVAIENELRVARSIQEAFLPQYPPTFPGFKFEAHCEMCHQVGGDYCGFAPVDDDRLSVAVGDVEGHGVASALLMANVQSCLSTVLKRRDPIEECLAQVNELLLEQAHQGRLMTLLLGFLNRREHTFHYASAGHPMPILVRDNKLVELSRIASDIPLGIISKHRFNTEPVIQLEPGDLLVLLTDGILEAVGENDEEFGRKRLEQALLHQARHPEERIIDSVLKLVADFRSSPEPEDDYTVLATRVLDFDSKNLDTRTTGEPDHSTRHRSGEDLQRVKEMIDLGFGVDEVG